MGTNADLVVLLDEDHRPAGAAPRAEVHDAATPLHLAFSCYLFDPEGRLLMTRRAVGKRSWPGVWTNSFCGHPRPGEPIEEAVHRYADHELGVRIRDLVPVLDDFVYRAVDPNGVVEHEVCPVFAAICDGPLEPDPTEVEEWRWVDLDDVLKVVSMAPWTVSPWMAAQVDRVDRQAGWPVVQAR